MIIFMSNDFILLLNICVNIMGKTLKRCDVALHSVSPIETIPERADG